MTKQRKKRSRGTGLWIDFDVQGLATDPDFRRFVRRIHFRGVDWRAPRRKGLPKNLPAPAHRLYEPVRATIEISAYLTVKVPERLRRRVCSVRCAGDALVAAADMFLKVYQENEQRGGAPALATKIDVDKRVATRRRKGGSALLNRGRESYVWGHDLSDLVFERIYIDWANTRECRIKFDIGS